MKRILLLLMLACLLLSGISCSRNNKAFRITLIKYLDNSYTRCFEDELMTGLTGAGLIAGQDFQLKIRSAQGDMSSLTMLVDAAENSKTDLLITFQSPTLFTAIRRAPTVNKMFTLLQNPFILGAGESDTNHLEHLTGMYLIPPYKELLDLAGECKPAITRLGVIYDSGNDDSVYRKDDLVRVAAEHHMEVVAIPYTAQNEILTATDALMAEKPHAVIHLQDPSQDVTFPALFKNASRQKIPVFSVVFNMEKIGAVIACSTDRGEIGRRFAQMAVRVVKGEDPSSIPFENDGDLPKRIGYNTTVARDINLTLPASLTTTAP